MTGWLSPSWVHYFLNSLLLWENWTISTLLSVKKGCFVGKLVKETWLVICLHLRSVISAVHEILRLTHQWQGPSTPSYLREQKDSSAHIAEAKITLMVFLFPVVHTHCPVKIQKGRSACCQISTDATLQSSPQVHVSARECTGPPAAHLLRYSIPWCSGATLSYENAWTYCVFNVFLSNQSMS